MNCERSIGLRFKKCLLTFALLTSLLSISYAQTITINKQLFVGGTYRDSSNITVPIDIDVRGSNGFGYDTSAAFKRFNNNIFLMVLVPAANANAIFTDTSASLILAGAKVIGRYRFNNDQVPYTTYVNGIIPPLGVGIATSNYVIRVISTRPFISSDASAVFTVNRANARKVKSFAVAGSVGNTSAIYYDATHSSMFFGYCGNIVDKNGKAIDTSISLLDSTAGNFNTASSYDSVILVNNSFHGLVNTDSVVYRGKYTAKGAINFPSAIMKGGEYYTIILKALDDSGYVSSKSYFLLNTSWNFNISKTTSSSNGCKGDTVSLYPIKQLNQLGQEFGFIDNFPGLLYNVNWGDPKSATAINYTFNELVSNGGLITHRYDTTSCYRPSGSQYWSISARLVNPFTGSNCSFPIATSTVQIFASVKAKFVHHAPVCVYTANSPDSAQVTLKDSSYAGSNITCTGSAYYTWYKTYVGCGTINDTIANPFVAVDSSSKIQSGVIVPIAVSNYDHKDTFTLPGKYIFKIFADNKSCKTDGYIDSIMVVAPPKTNFKMDSSGVLKDTIGGCAPLTVKVRNLSDSTCSQKWNFKWEVIDTTTKTVVTPGTIYKIPAPYKNTDAEPNIVFYKQGIYKIRLIGSNACSKGDTTYKLVTVIGNGGVTFPSGNKITANNFETNAYCLYLTPSKTVNFDSSVRTPAGDTTMKPLYGGTPAVTNPYNWVVTDIAGTHKYNAPTDSTKKYPSITFTTPLNKDGDFMIAVTYSSTCGVSNDSFELILNRQVVPKIIEPTKDTSICPNSGCIQFTGTATAADGTNSGYTSLQWLDQSNLFGNSLIANLCNINATKTISFKVIKAQPNACPDTAVPRKITVLPNPTGRDTSFSICSGTKLNYNLATTSSASNTFTWNSVVTSGSVTGNSSCSSACTTITDILNGNGAQSQVIYIVTPIGPNGCPGNTFQVIVNILPYPTIAHSVVKDTICSGSLSNITISTNTSGATYNWSIANQGALQPYGTWPAYTNQIPTYSNAILTGSPLNIAYINNGLKVDSFRVLFTVSVAGGTCSSPADSITMYVIPGPTQPKANVGGSDSIYLCNQGNYVLNGTQPNLIKGEIGKWTPVNTPPQAVITATDSTKYNANVIIAAGNVYQLQWSITSPLATAFGCPSLSDVVTIFNRPKNTVATVGNDTTLCKYAGLLTNIPLNGNSVLNPWEIGTWTVVHPNQATSDSLKSTGLDSSHKYNDTYIFWGGTGEYDLVWTIRNDANCPVSSATFRIGAGFGNNSIFKDTVLCNGQSITGLTGSLPQGGGGSYVYQWYTGVPGSGSGSSSAIPGATSQDYTPVGGLKPAVTTQYYRTTSSVKCPTANLPSNTVTVSVNQSPKAGFITTLDTSCAPFKLDTSIIRLDTTNYPIDTSCTYTWYVNGVLVANGPKFSVNGLYTIPNPGDSAIVELRDSSKRGCGNVVVLQHTFYTRIKPVPTFNTSNGLWSSCNASDFTFINTTVNPGLYQGWHWDFGEGDTANTQNPPQPQYHYLDAVGKDSVYTVCLSAWTACHDTVKYCKTITIQSKPHPSFYASTYSGCAPLKTILYNTTLGIVDSSKWYWYYPANLSDTSVIDHSIIPVNTPLPHSFPYTADVMLKVYNKCGVDSTVPIHFSVAYTAVNVKIGLSFNDQYACAPHTTHQIYNAVGADKVDMWSYQIAPIVGTPNIIPDFTTNVTAGIHDFTFANPGKYVIMVKGSNFCDSMVQYDTVTIFPTPFPQFNLAKDTFCVGDTVWPINKTTTPNVSYYWSFSTTGKGLPTPATSSAQSPFVVFTNPGADSIALGTTISYPMPSPGYCSDTTKRAIFIVTTQKANLVVSNNHPSCIPATVTFTNNSPSNGFPPASWHFNYPNANPSATGTNTPSYTYQDTGTYTVVLDTKSQGGCLYTDTQKIVVTSPFAQVWKYDHGYICGATPVSFQVMNPSGVDSIFLWHFGDGTPAVATPSNTPNVFHVYRNCGNYFPSVDLIAKGGCKYTLNWNTGDTIKVDSVKAGFAYVVNKNCGNTVLSFTDTSNACSGFNANSWDWNFGDIGLPSNFSTLQYPSHTYKVSDLDTVQLKVTANSGCTNTYRLPINIKVNSVPQITSHVINPFNGVTACTGQSVTYSGTATSIDPIKDYVWTFSNAPTFNGTKVTNAYPAVGTYYDTLTVSTIFGCIAQFPASVNVFQTPTIAIAQTNPPEICRGATYPLNATTTDPGTTTFLWGPAPIVTCVNANCSNVTVNPTTNSVLYVQGLASNGCTGYGDTVLLKVIQPITLTVSPSTDTICIGQSVQLHGVSIGATAFVWDAKDSSLNFDSIPDPIATPKHIGMNVYTLRASNTCFKDSVQVHIAVGGYPIISLGNPGYDTIIVQTGSTLPMSNYVHLSADTFKTYVWTPSTGLNCNNCADPVVTVAGDQLYTLKATTVYGCSDTDYLYIKTFCQNSQVYIPNAFTPDGDGRNDVLMVRGSGIKIVKNFRIYNRWGQVVFERANFNVNDPQFGWNGKVRNTNEFSPPDVYVYYCEVLCEDDTPFTYQGNITLVK